MKSKSGVWRPPTSVKVFVILQALRNFPDVTILNIHFGQDPGGQGSQGSQGGQCFKFGQDGYVGQNGQGGQTGQGSAKWF